MRNHLPKPQAIVQVYAVIAFMLSAWTITAFAWKLSTWLMFLNLGEIFIIFSYALMTNLLESLAVILLLVVISAILPARFLRDDFIVRGTILSIGLLGALMVYLRVYMEFELEKKDWLVGWPMTVLVLMSLLLIFSSRLRWLRSAATWLSDHLTVFLFILLPLYLILSGYVIIRYLA